MARSNSKPFDLGNENLKNPKPEGGRNDSEEEGWRPQKTTKKPVKEDEGTVTVNSKTKAAKGGSDAKAKKEKKVYILPGQKHDPPEERDPLRIFYSSLHRQKPESEMAEVWMMEHGLLSADKAKEVYERKHKKQSKVSAKSRQKKDLSDDDKMVQRKVSAKSVQKKDLSDDDKKVQRKFITKSGQKKDLSDGDKKVQPKVSTKSIRNPDHSDDDKRVQPKVATKSNQKKRFLDEDDKKVQPASRVGSSGRASVAKPFGCERSRVQFSSTFLGLSSKKDLSDGDKKVQPKVSTKSIRNQDHSDDDKRVQPKVATKSNQKKRFLDEDDKPQPKVSKKPRMTILVYSDDESGDFAQPKKRRSL